MNVFDAAYPPNIATCKANGAIAISRYVAGGGQRQWKRLSLAETDRILAAGLGVIYNYEGQADEALHAGRTGGLIAARIAIADSINLGRARADGSEAIYYSVDVNTPASAFGAIADYFRGIRDGTQGRFQIKFYGQGSLGDYLLSLGLIDGKYWLSGSTSFPGYDRNSPHVCMWQHVGSPVAGTDLNTVTDASELGAHFAGVSYKLLNPTSLTALFGAAAMAIGLLLGLDPISTLPQGKVLPPQSIATPVPGAPIVPVQPPIAQPAPPTSISPTPTSPKLPAKRVVMPSGCSITIHPGDVLSRRDPSNWRADARLNHINAHRIFPGQVIRLAKCGSSSSVSSPVARVSPGKHRATTRRVKVIHDISTTAAHYGLKTKTVLAYNPQYKAHPDFILAGATLAIPN